MASAPVPLFLSMAFFFFFLMGIISRWKEPLLVHSGLPKELIVAPPLVWCGNLLVPYLPPETLQRRKAFNSFIPSSPSLSLHRLSLGGVCVCALEGPSHKQTCLARQ